MIETSSRKRNRKRRNRRLSILSKSPNNSISVKMSWTENKQANKRTNKKQTNEQTEHKIIKINQVKQNKSTQKPKRTRPKERNKTTQPHSLRPCLVPSLNIDGGSDFWVWRRLKSGWLVSFLQMETQNNVWHRIFLQNSVPDCLAHFGVATKLLQMFFFLMIF